MKRYKVTGRSFNVPTGLIELTAGQAKDRIHCLDPQKKVGLYNILKPIQFKHGEEFGYDGEVNKINLEDVSDTSKKDSNASDITVLLKGSNKKVQKALEDAGLTVVELESLLVVESKAKKPRKSIQEFLEIEIDTEKLYAILDNETVADITTALDEREADKEDLELLLDAEDKGNTREDVVALLKTRIEGITE